MIKNTKETHRAIGFAPGERPKGDFYATPPEAVQALLRHETFGEMILEPCCGDGAISKILEALGYTVISRDLYDWGYGETGLDFLTEPVLPVDAVVTNPPFKFGLQFAQQALACTKEKQGKVALLNRIQWLEGIKRRAFFESSPLSRVLVFSKRIPRMHRFDFEGDPCTSMMCFAWFIWDWSHEGKPLLEWI